MLRATFASSGNERGKVRGHVDHASEMRLPTSTAAEYFQPTLGGGGGHTEARHVSVNGLRSLDTIWDRLIHTTNYMQSYIL